MRAIPALAAAALALILACGEDSISYTKECQDLWDEEVFQCWSEYCQHEPGHNQLFCDCFADQQSLDGPTCGCSGLARDSFLDACSGQEPPVRFDCAEDMKRLAELSDRWKCCKFATDCNGGECGPDHRCK